MKKTSYWLLAGIFAMTMSLGNDAEAGRKRRFNRADRNDDGRIDRREAKQERRRYKKHKAKVDTKWEKKADKNKDGIVQPGERRRAHAKGYLKHKTEVDTKWEKAADTDGNGSVSAAELRDYRISKWTTTATAK